LLQVTVTGSTPEVAHDCAKTGREETASKAVTAQARTTPFHNRTAGQQENPAVRLKPSAALRPHHIAPLTYPQRRAELPHDVQLPIDERLVGGLIVVTTVKVDFRNLWLK
jgi:hypothetical protein